MTIEELDYELLPDDNGPRSCFCCGYERIPLRITKLDHPVMDSTGRTRNVPVCEICSDTYLGVMAEYSQNFTRGEVHLAKAVAWVGNRILEEIRNACNPNN